MSWRSTFSSRTVVLLSSALPALAVACGRVNSGNASGDGAAGVSEAPGGSASGGQTMASVGGRSDGAQNAGGSGGGQPNHTTGGAGGEPSSTVEQGGAGQAGQGGDASQTNCDPSLVRSGPYSASMPRDLEALRGYARIEGDLEIKDLADLSPLECLSEVTGRLTLRSLTVASLEDLSHLRSVELLDIEGCEALESLAGLEGLTHLNSIGLFDNPVLSSLEPLASVPFEGEIDIVNQPRLTTLAGLRSTRTITGAWLGGLSLASLHGLEQLERVDALLVEGVSGLRDMKELGAARSISDLRLLDNPDLESLAGLGRIEALDTLSLSGDPKLTDISALSSLSSLGQVSLGNIGITDLAVLSGVTTLTSLDISECGSLVSVHGLEQVSQVSGSLSITKNPMLGDLLGLSGLEYTDRLTIADNAALPTCDAEHLRDRVLTGGAAFVEISNNDDAAVCP